MLETTERRIRDETVTRLEEGLGKVRFASIYAAGQTIALRDAADVALGAPHAPAVV